MPMNQVNSIRMLLLLDWIGKNVIFLADETNLTKTIAAHGAIV